MAVQIPPADMTYIVVDNEDLKKHPQGYQAALNWVDHIIYRHRLVDGQFKWIPKLRLADIRNCNTKWAYVFMVGHRTDPRVIRNHADNEASLQGHILDRKKNYYELHHQSFIVRVDHIGDANFMYDESYRSIERSDENYHDDWTPLWVKDGKEELEIEKPSYGSGLISKLLRDGRKVTPYTPEMRAANAFLYHNQVYKKTQNFNHAYLNEIFPVSTEMTVDVDVSGYEHFIGPANGFQALLYTNPNLKSITICDINPLALDFTRKLFYTWSANQSYEEFLQEHNIPFSTEVTDWNKPPDEYFWKIHDLNPDIITIIKKIQNNEIPVEFLSIDLTDVDVVDKRLYKEKTLLYYSNILTYAPTIYLRPLLDCDLIWQALMAYMPDQS